MQPVEVAQRNTVAFLRIARQELQLLRRIEDSRIAISGAPLAWDRGSSYFRVDDPSRLIVRLLRDILTSCESLCPRSHISGTLIVKVQNAAAFKRSRSAFSLLGKKLIF